MITRTDKTIYKIMFYDALEDEWTEIADLDQWFETIETAIDKRDSLENHRPHPYAERNHFGVLLMSGNVPIYEVNPPI